MDTLRGAVFLAALAVLFFLAFRDPGPPAGP